MDTGNLTLRTNSTAHEILVDPKTGKARGVAFVDSRDAQVARGEGEGRRRRREHARVGAAAAALEVAAAPNGIGNSSGHVGHNFCEHLMGPGVTGLVKELVGKEHGIEDGRPGRLLRPALPQPRPTSSPASSAATASRGAAGRTIFPDSTDRPGFGKQYKKEVRDYSGAFINMGGFGEVLPRYENSVSIDPEVKDAWGIPVLRFDYKFGDNEKKMAEDMAVTAKEMFEAAGIEVIGVDRELLTEGWSIHELGTSRMGSDPKTSVLNQFQQSHDVKNLFVVDGSSHVNASCQNPTWTIMALAWRSCDHLADELKKGNL